MIGVEIELQKNSSYSGWDDKRLIKKNIYTSIHSSRLWRIRMPSLFHYHVIKNNIDVLYELIALMKLTREQIIDISNFQRLD